MKPVSKKGYELLEHTADAKLRVYAETLEGLFEAGGEAVSDLLAGLQNIRPEKQRKILLEGRDLPLLFRDWLGELVYLFDAEGFVGRTFEARVAEDGLRAVARGETYDPERHDTELYIKGATYHQLALNETPGGWEALVILDV